MDAQIPATNLTHPRIEKVLIQNEILRKGDFPAKKFAGIGRPERNPGGIGDVIRRSKKILDGFAVRENGRN